MVGRIAAVMTLSVGFALAVAGSNAADEINRKDLVNVTGKPEVVERLALREAARRSYDLAFERLKARTLSDLEPLYRWSIRLRDADLAFAGTKESARAASTKHLERMTAVKQQAVGSGDPDKLSAAEYYYLDAKESLRK